MRELLGHLKLPLAIAAMISIGVNLLMLVSPIFMMQVFDRVLVSGHLETLFGLTLLAVVALLVLGLFDSLRNILLVRAGDWLDRYAGDVLIDSVLVREDSATQAFKNIAAVRRFFCAPAVFALLDAPWLFVFAAVLWWMHPWLGMTAIAGAAVLLLVAVATEIFSRQPLKDATKFQRESQMIMSSALKNTDVVKAMGMAPALKSRWAALSRSASQQQTKAGERSAALSATAKAVRLIIQISILAIGAALVVQGNLSPGGMIAGSILLGRCLAPAEQAIGAWKNFILARDAWSELSKMQKQAGFNDSMELPSPEGYLETRDLHYSPIEGRPPVLEAIQLKITPGQILAVIGPSGAGKSTLCRILVGALEPTHGEVSLDGRSVTGWNTHQLGQHVGFVPQGVDLLPGTLQENIQRFGEDDPKGVVEAAQSADVDKLIRSLPDGYDTQITPGGVPVLSAGQMQRVALARALYGKPRLIVLDEPNAAMDVDGEKALSRSLRKAADEGALVVVVTHRTNLLQIADRVAVLQAGHLIKEGPKEEIVRPRGKPANSGTNPAEKQEPAAADGNRKSRRPLSAVGGQAHA